MTHDDVKEQSAKLVRRAAAQVGSQRQLAEMIGVHPKSVSRWATEGTAPEPRAAVKLARILDCDPSRVRPDIFPARV